MIAQRLALLAVMPLVACTDLMGISEPEGEFVEVLCDPSVDCVVEHRDVTLVIPAGALRDVHTIGIYPDNAPLPSGYDDAGNVYRFTPEGLRFDKPVLLKMRYAGIDHPGIWWSTLAKDGYNHLGGTFFSTEPDRIGAEIIHLDRGFVGKEIPTRTIVGIETVTLVTNTSVKLLNPNDLRGEQPRVVYPDGGSPLKSGEGFGDGTFQIPDVSLDYEKAYWLSFKGEHHYVSGSAVSLSSTELGRPDQQKNAASKNTDLVFHAGGLQSWAACSKEDKGDTLQVFSIDTDIWWLQAQRKAKIIGLPPGGAEQLTGFTIDSFKGDAFGQKSLIEGGDLTLTQLARPHVGDPHRAMVRVLSKRSITQQDGVPLVVQDGDMTHVQPSNTAKVRFAGEAKGKIRFTIGLQPGGLSFGTFSARPDLLTIEDTADVISRAEGMSYGRPSLDGTWAPYWSASWDSRTHELPPAAPVPFPRNVVHGPVQSPSSTIEVKQQASPVLTPTIDGSPAFFDDRSIGPQPRFAWHAPGSGAPDHYRVDIYLLDTVGGGCDNTVETTRSTRKATFRTAAAAETMSLTLPSGIFELGKPYVVAITAVVLEGTRSAGVLPQHHVPRSEASVISGILRPAVAATGVTQD